MGFFFRWAILTIAVWVATQLVPGVDFNHDRPQDLLLAALVLGVLNAFVKPVLRLLTLPFILLTFGFFLLAINAGLLWLTAKLVHGFTVSGFWPAVWASLVVSLVSFLLGTGNHTSRPHARVVFGRHPPPPTTPQQGPPPGKGPIIDV